MTEHTPIDDMRGLYTHMSDAFRAGKRAGHEEFYRLARDATSAISVKYEHGTDAAPFHAAEQCCKAIAEIKTALAKPAAGTLI